MGLAQEQRLDIVSKSAQGIGSLIIQNVLSMHGKLLALHRSL
jgi:hypothetical protein